MMSFFARCALVPTQSSSGSAAQFIDERLAELRQRPDRLIEAEDTLTRALQERNIYFGDGLLPTYPVPFFAPADELASWATSAELLAGTVEDVANEALRDKSLMKALQLRDDARDWVAIDPGYAQISVLARPDAVFLDGAVRYVEYNSDSPAMMAFSDHVSECLMALPHLRAHAARLRTETMLPRLYDTLLQCYREYGGTKEAPTIAMCDWPGQKTRFEQARISEYLTSRGCPTVVCDPRQLTRPGKHLEYAGRRIDLVYRRALFVELLDKKDEVEPLISAYRDGAVCMVNPLRSYLASSKTLLAFLCRNWPASHGICPVLPTRLLDGPRVAALSACDENVVLKKGESHGGLHVLLPGFASPEERRRALLDATESPWVDQDFAPIPKMRIPTRAAPHAEKYFNWNPFLFGGRYVGGIARASDTPLINITLGGGLLPTICVEG